MKKELKIEICVCMILALISLVLFIGSIQKRNTINQQLNDIKKEVDYIEQELDDLKQFLNVKYL